MLFKGEIDDKVYGTVVSWARKVFEVVEEFGLCRFWRDARNSDAEFVGKSSSSICEGRGDSKEIYKLPPPIHHHPQRDQNSSMLKIENFQQFKFDRHSNDKRNHRETSALIKSSSNQNKNPFKSKGIKHESMAVDVDIHLFLH
jgi:hypothetical protein